MQPVCEECNRLWQEYGAATMAHIASDCELRLAALRHETENITILTLEAEDALDKRKSLREAIRKHDAATGHGNRGSTAHSKYPTTPQRSVATR